MKELNSDVLEQQITQKVSFYYSLMLSENLQELEIKEKGLYLYLKRKSKSNSFIKTQVKDFDFPEIQEQVEKKQDTKKEHLTIKSPIIGVFYRAPSPSSPPFVKEGDIVEQGKTLCIVEAMKVMNEIKAEYKMKIIKILAENGKPINANQDIFIVEKV